MPSPSSIAMADEWAEIDSTVLDGGADRSRAYYYLAGKMSGIPQFNFPMFDKVAAELRERGYNLLSPAELDHEQERKKVMSSKTGDPNKTEGVKTWADCLRRDVEVITDDNCVGIICIPGWEESRGARLETYVAAALGLPIYEYAEEGVLVEIDRKAMLTAAGIED